MSLGLALLMLAVLGMGMLLHLTVPAYPLPSVKAAVLLWVGMVLPAVVLVTTLGFAIVTLLPRLSTLVKVVTLVAWIVGALLIPPGFRHQIPPGWYVNWDPTSAVTAIGMLPQYSFENLMRTVTTEAQFQNAFVALGNQMPSVGSWLGCPGCWEASAWCWSSWCRLPSSGRATSSHNAGGTERVRGNSNGVND